MVMKHFIKALSALALLFNGTGAIYGGISLITDPTGSGIGLDSRLLQYTSFSSFLIPGIILLCINGILSLTTLALLLSGYRKVYILLLLQGILLEGWIIIQIILIRTFYPPMHISLLVTGLIITVCGFYYYKIQKS